MYDKLEIGVNFIEIRWSELENATCIHIFSKLCNWCEALEIQNFLQDSTEPSTMEKGMLLVM